MTSYALPPALVQALDSLARQPRTRKGATRGLAERFGYAAKTLVNYLQERRAELRDEQETDGAEGGPADAVPAPVPRGAPSAAAPGSGHDVRGLDVSSLNSAPAVHDPRPVVPAAGPSPPRPLDRASEGPAAPFSGMPAAAPSLDSPGLCWARAAMAKGLDVHQVLRKGGDRLTYRDRAALKGEVAHG